MAHSKKKNEFCTIRMAIENGQMSLWNRKTWARMAQPKAKIVNPPHLISPPPTPSLTSQTPLFRSLDSNFGEKVKCSISCLSSSPKISLVHQSHLMIITLAFKTHQFHHNPDQDQDQLTLFWGCDISRKSVDDNLSSNLSSFVRASTLRINQEQELSVPVRGFPPTPVCPSVQLGEGGADHVNLAPALLTFDFERMSCCPRSWWCEPSTCPLHSQTCRDGLVWFGLKALF